MLHPFDLKAALLARHAQHVVLIHFPIALYVAGTFFDVCTRVFRKAQLAEVARWNFLGAAMMSVPAAITGVLAWRFALEGQALKGVLRLHLVLAGVVITGLWFTVWLQRRRNASQNAGLVTASLVLECAVCLMVGATAHLGGFLSGVNP